MRLVAAGLAGLVWLILYSSGVGSVTVVRAPIVIRSLSLLAHKNWDKLKRDHNTILALDLGRWAFIYHLISSN